MSLLQKISQMILIGVISFFLVNCASDYQFNLESAKFALDKRNYTEAINYATKALNANPGDPVAARLLANAYLGRSSIDYLDLVQGLLDLSDSTDTNFQSIANVLPSSATMADLRSAIEALETVTGVDSSTITSEDVKDVAFDLGIMQMIEHFAIGVYSSDFFGTFDVSQITDADAANVLDDLVDFDNRLIASGVDSTESFISEVRQTYCLLEGLSAGSGFTTSEYRALVACQLSSDASAVDTTAIDAGIANCAALDPANASSTCLSSDTSL